MANRQASALESRRREAFASAETGFRSRTLSLFAAGAASFAFLASLILFVFAPCSRAASLPSGFSEEVLASKLDYVTAMAVADDGRIFVAEQTGRVLVIEAGVVSRRPLLDLGERLDTYWERGLLGIALDPDFPRTPYVYVLYVAKEPFVHHVVSRFTVHENCADPVTERILLQGDDQGKFGGNLPAGHQGGPLCFGTDGKLYVGLGEQTHPELSQSLDCLQGKILRINPDGSIPPDNPFVAATNGSRQAIWGLGIRNPYGIAAQRETSQMFVTDVGESSFEEVDELLKGENYGWPEAEGMSKNPKFKNPLYTYPPVIGRCICGGAFYPMEPVGGGSWFPAEWHGKFFFLDWAAGWLKALDPNDPQSPVTFAHGFDRPIAVKTAPDGSLIVLNRGTIWRDGKDCKAASGSVVRISFTGEPAKIIPAFPDSLLAAGLCSRNDSSADRSLLLGGHLGLTKEFHPFEINLEPWQPGIRCRRWINIPAGKKIAVSPGGEFNFPIGTLLVQHYEAVTKSGADIPFETHLFWFTGSRTVRAAAYRWAADLSDAQIVQSPGIVDLPEGSQYHWFSPGAEGELNLDMLPIGFQAPVNVRQLNRLSRDAEEGGLEKNQLVLWSEKGWLEPPISGEQSKTAAEVIRHGRRICFCVGSCAFVPGCKLFCVPSPWRDGAWQFRCTLFDAAQFSETRRR